MTKQEFIDYLAEHLTYEDIQMADAEAKAYAKGFKEGLEARTMDAEWEGESDMEERICGYCAYHKKDEKGWMCVNERSDSCGEYTGFSERCPDFEGREEDGFVTRQ